MGPGGVQPADESVAVTSRSLQSSYSISSDLTMGDVQSQRDERKAELPLAQGR